MNKKLMALAVAGALAAPVVAFAQASNVQMYGRINTGYDNYSATGATAGAAGDVKGRGRVFDSGSRLGVRGSEDLGGGLRAIFQIESGLNIDNGLTTGQGGYNNGSAGTLASRDSYLGIAGNWGQVTFGKQSYFWSGAGVNDQIAANYINSGIPWSNAASFGRVAGPAAREQNTMQYRSPNWSGFTIMGNYTFNGEAIPANANQLVCAAGSTLIPGTTQCVTTTSAAPATTLYAATATPLNADAKKYGFTLGYSSGPFDMHYDYAQNVAASGAATRLTIVGNKIDFGWAYMPGARISAIWARNKNDQTAAFGSTNANGVDSISQQMWVLNWEHMFGNIQALAQWGKLNSASGCTVAGACSNTGATAWTLAGRYMLSKRTNLYASYMIIRNDSVANQDYVAGGYSSASSGVIQMALGNGSQNGPVPGLQGASLGADPRIWGVGIHHNF